jgi:hypothetical protein
MDIILHLGAHRTATTSFQSWMRAQASRLEACHIGFWGPHRTRSGLLAGVLPQPGLLCAEQQLDRARGRIALQLARSEAQGLRALVISDENLLGTPRRALRDRSLYQGAGLRLARHQAAFDGRVSTVHLSIRALDRWWASLAALAVSRGEPVPSRASFAAIAANPRSWRDLITDVACAFPGAALQVSLYEEVAGQPAVKLHAMTGQTLSGGHGPDLNPSPSLAALRRLVEDRGEDPDHLESATSAAEGAPYRWQPFTQDEAAVLHEKYADDLFWLAAGAEGLAQLTGNWQAKDGANPQPAQTKRGSNHDQRKGCVA